MSLSPEIKKFISEHLSEDVSKLLLNAARYPGIDVPFATGQIEARRQIREKLPEWYDNGELFFPSRLSAEQCSSAITAKYKQRLISGTKVCDLTGGLGVDSFYFSQVAEEVVYTERFPEYCRAAEWNFRALGAGNIRILNKDAADVAGSQETDTFYIDPARRAEGNRRVYALSDCEPDIIQLKPLLLDRAKRVIVKISPMADLDETLRFLPETRAIHILSVKNECKELLFVMEPGIPGQSPEIHAINFLADDRMQTFVFNLPEEKEALLEIAPQPEAYLYEPNTSLLKAGAFRLPCARFGVRKLHQHSHLYTSAAPIAEFPGRSFSVDEIIGVSGKTLKKLSSDIPKANLTVRNFNMTVAELRQRSGIREGGDIYLFATTLADGSRVMIRCHKN